MQIPSRTLIDIKLTQIKQTTYRFFWREFVYRGKCDDEKKKIETWHIELLCEHVKTVVPYVWEK